VYTKQKAQYDETGTWDGNGADAAVVGRAELVSRGTTAFPGNSTACCGAETTTRTNTLRTRLVDADLLDCRGRRPCVPTPAGLQITNFDDLNFHKFEFELSGTLPPEIGQMTALSALVFHVRFGGVTGTIPTTLGMLTRLTEMRMLVMRLPRVVMLCLLFAITAHNTNTHALRCNFVMLEQI